MKLLRALLRRYALQIVIILSVAVGMFSGLFIARSTTENQIIELLKSRPAPKTKVEQTLQLIQSYYVDSLSVDSLSEKLMPLLVDELDPHTTYIPAKDFSRMNETLDGEFDGIGIVFNMATDTVIVLNVIASGPSAKVGMLARDRIITINDSLVAGRKIRQDSIVSKLRGERGTKVRLGVERAGIEGLVDIEVTRGKIPIHSIESSLMLTDSIGYIRLGQFARTSYSEFIDAMNGLLNQGLRSLIFDLRGNSGGFMDQAIVLANEFLPKSTLIVYTEDREGHQERQYSSYEGQLQAIELVVLIDESSASSSEILAGALQDNDKGTIIGRRSYGKGLVQRQIPFADGSALRLTTARYFTPTGRSIQKPYEMGDKEGYERDIITRIEHEELFTADSIVFVDSLRFTTPKGKIVYGGGGIMPDIFVPVSKEELPKYYIEVMGRNLVFTFTIEYADKHREELAAVTTLEQLNTLLDANTGLVDEFIRYAAKRGVTAPKEELAQVRDMLEKQLRANIGRNTELSDNGFIINIYTLDDTIMRAIEELRK